MEIKTLEQAFANINNSQLFSYSKRIELSSRSVQQQITIQLNSYDFFCFLPYIALTDSSGRRLDVSDHPRNEFMVRIKAISKGSDFGERLMSISAFNQLHTSQAFRGILFPSREQISVSIEGQDKPSSDVGDYSYYAHICFIGYHVRNMGSNIKYVTSKQDLSQPYNYNRSKTITGRNYDSDSDNPGSLTFRVNSQGYKLNHFAIEVFDSDGKKLLSPDGNFDCDKPMDEFLYSLKDNHGTYRLDGIPLSIINKISDAKFWRGFYITGTSEIEQRIKGAGSQTCKILYFDALTAKFAVGDTITGGTSSDTGVIVDIVSDGSSGYLILQDAGDFQDNETITGANVGSATTDGAATAGANNYNLEARINLTGYDMQGGN